MGRSDWEYVFNTFSFGYAIGYHFIATGMYDIDILVNDLLIKKIISFTNSREWGDEWKLFRYRSGSFGQR